MQARWIRPSDETTVVRLLNEGYPGEAWTPADVRKFSRPSRYHIVKVLAHGDLPPVAVIIVDVRRKMLFRIRRLTVDAKLRRRGAGRGLLEAVIGRAVAYRQKYLVGVVSEDNDEGLLFAKAIGFAATTRVIRRHFNPRWADGDRRDGYLLLRDRSPADQKNLPKLTFAEVLKAVNRGYPATKA